MTYQHVKWVAAAAASLGLAALAGCHKDSNTAPATPVASTNGNFSTLAIQAYSNTANSTPVEVNGFVFNYDVDNQPTYFNGLIAMGSYQ